MKIEYVETTQNNLSNVPIQAGQVVLTSDTHRQYLDFTSERKNLAFKNEVDVNASAIEAIVNRYSSKNLLPNYKGSTEINGVTFTVRDDGSILINGTATNSVYYNFCYIDFGSGTMNTWDHPYSATNGLIISSGNPNINMQYEGGNKATYVVIANGATVDNQIAYPMIRDARIKDDTYVPYSMTNKELTDKVDKSKTVWATANTEYTFEYRPSSLLSLSLDNQSGGTLYIITGQPQLIPVVVYNDFTITKISTSGPYITVKPSKTGYLSLNY